MQYVVLQYSWVYVAANSFVVANVTGSAVISIRVAGAAQVRWIWSELGLLDRLLPTNGYVLKARGKPMFQSNHTFRGQWVAMPDVYPTPSCDKFGVRPPPPPPRGRPRCPSLSSRCVSRVDPGLHYCPAHSSLLNIRSWGCRFATFGPPAACCFPSKEHLVCSNPLSATSSCGLGEVIQCGQSTRTIS